MNRDGRRLFLGATGDRVPWEALDDAERCFYSTPPPWEVAEFGMFVWEYVQKVQRDEFLAFLYQDEGGMRPPQLEEEPNGGRRKL